MRSVTDSRHPLLCVLSRRPCSRPACAVATGPNFRAIIWNDQSTSDSPSGREPRPGRSIRPLARSAAHNGRSQRPLTTAAHNGRAVNPQRLALAEPLARARPQPQAVTHAGSSNDSDSVLAAPWHAPPRRAGAQPAAAGLTTVRPARREDAQSASESGPSQPCGPARPYARAWRRRRRALQTRSLRAEGGRRSMAGRSVRPWGLPPNARSRGKGCAGELPSARGARADVSPSGAVARAGQMLGLG